MADTTAPVLLGLELPSVIEADAFYRALLVTARASDPGGEGVRRVVVYFDKPINLADHLWVGTSDQLVIDGLFSGNTFHDATPDTASRSLPATSYNMSGDYRITKVAVEDMAGNRSVYSSGQLQAMGVNTSFELKGGHHDTTAPVLRKLVLPSSIDLSSGQAALALAGEVVDDPGGTGVTFMKIEFDRPLVSSFGSSTGTSIAFAAGAGASGQPLSFTDSTYLLSGETAPGTYQIARVSLVDRAGNETVYTSAQLKALGFNTELQVGGSKGTAATLAPAVSEDGFVLALAPTAWKAGDNSFRLVIGYDPTKTSYVKAALGEGALGDLSVAMSEDGTAGTLVITGSGSFQAGSAIEVSLRQLKAMEASAYQVKEFVVNGVAQAFPDAGGYLQALRGSEGNDRFNTDVRLIDGGAGYDVVDFSSAREEATITRSEAGVKVLTADGKSYTLANVERLNFGEDYVVFDEDGLAAQAWRLYRAAFDRTPDREGLGYWISQLEDGMAREEMAAWLMASGEFGPLQNTAAFVTSLYRNVLDREPDAGGLAYWTQVIDAGQSRQAVLVAFSDAPENLAKVIGETGNGIEYALW